MPQVLTQEFKRLPLRVHIFLADVPLHDVSVVDLFCWHARVTLQDFLRTGIDCLCTPPPLVRMLLDIRFFVGRFFSWDRDLAATLWKPWQLVLPTRIVRIHWPRLEREMDFSVSSTASKISSLLS
jgi:hypothetical protein